MKLSPSSEVRPNREVLTTMLIASALLLSAAFPHDTKAVKPEGPGSKTSKTQSPGGKQVTAQDALPLVLKQQADCWNKGDLDGFMKSYLNSPSISYTSSGEVFYGYDALKKRYVEKYGSKKDTMGQLGFSDLNITALGASDALCVGNWHLERTKQPTVDGVFSLVFTKTNDGWKIIHDHTSAKLAKTESKKS